MYIYSWGPCWYVQRASLAERCAVYMHCDGPCCEEEDTCYLYVQRASLAERCALYTHCDGPCCEEDDTCTAKSNAVHTHVSIDLYIRVRIHTLYM